MSRCIKISTFDGKHVELDLEPGSTVLDIKTAIQSKESIPVITQSILSEGGCVLNNTHSADEPSYQLIVTDVLQVGTYYGIGLMSETLWRGENEHKYRIEYLYTLTIENNGNFKLGKSKPQISESSAPKHEEFQGQFEDGVFRGPEGFPSGGTVEILIRDDKGLCVKDDKLVGSVSFKDDIPQLQDDAEVLLSWAKEAQEVDWGREHLG